MKKYLLILLLLPLPAFGQNVFVTNPPLKAANVILRDASGNYVDASGGGGGGGGAVTVADGADVAEGATTDAAGAAGAAGSITAQLRRLTTDMGAVKTSVAAIPASPATTGNQTTGNTSLATIATNTGAAQPAGENHIGEVGGNIAIVGGSFTRPSDTTAYASGDLVANSTTAGSVVPITVSAARINDGTGMIRRVRLTKSGTSVTLASFRVHFYKASPTVTNGDNGAWLSTESTYLGACDVTVDKAFSDGSKGVGTPNNGSEINFLANTGTQNVFALIEARAAYSPASAEVFTLAVEVIRN